MPHPAPTSTFLADQPAIWLLNAHIPRTLQYGTAACSCWATGCGELDIAEALHAGSEMLKSTIHTNAPAGDSDYIARPTSAQTMRLAVVFAGSGNGTVCIQVLGGDVDFGATVTEEVVEGWCQGGAVSHFAVV